MQKVNLVYHSTIGGSCFKIKQLNVRLSATYNVIVSLFFALCLSACTTSSHVGTSAITATPISNTGATAASSPTSAQAARLLTQATFGVTEKDIQQVKKLGVKGWINDQIRQPQLSHLVYVSNLMKRPGIASTIKHSGHKRNLRMEAWWNISIKGKDQLRQRVAFALSELFVISDKENNVAKNAKFMAYYYDLLAKHAFGNYRDLLEDVTLSPSMGIYLGMLGNRKANKTGTIRPDENFAREVMQLFTIGLVQLNLNGTPKSDKHGNPIPTYTQTDIENYARVFTGWNYPGTTKKNWWRTSYNGGIRARMSAVQDFHDKGEKHLLRGVYVPAGQTAQEDLAQALDSLFHHPNVAPFVSKHLIQRLVTSNPRADYVARVARVFNNNGHGIRGDLGAVIKAILLDSEARKGHLYRPTVFGKLREPILQVTHFWRAFNVFSPNGRIQYSDPESPLGQAPLSATSVFNFFSPTYSPNTTFDKYKKVAPEFEILNENQSARLNNFLNHWILKSRQYSKGAKATDNLLNLRQEMALLKKPEALIDRLDLLLMSGQMPKRMKTILLREFQSRRFNYLSDFKKVKHLIFLIMNTPQYAIQK